MTNRGSNFYDHNEVFSQYTSLRERPENANDTLEKPVMMDLLGDVRGKAILDLGCGDAQFGVELLQKGCSFYHGIDGSKNMIDLAKQQIKHELIMLERVDLEEWNPPVAQYDLVVSRLVFHYLEDLHTIFDHIHTALKPGGAIIFSVEHPVITSTLQPAGLRTSWVVDHYFSMGYRTQQWLGGSVEKYHRTLEEYFQLLQESGFTIERLKESSPRREFFLSDETFERRKRIPLFLFLKATKKDVESKC